MLAAISIVLLVVLLAAVLTTTLPPKLMDPQWKLQFAAVLVNNATLPLVGALLMPLGLGFDPANPRLRARWISFRRWALPAALGFLLLIPLHGFAS